MASPLIQPLIDELTQTRGVLQSATVYVNSVPELMQTAINLALANGATAQELAPLSDLMAGLDTDGSALVAAIQANGGTATGDPNSPVDPANPTARGFNKGDSANPNRDGLAPGRHQDGPSGRTNDGTGTVRNPDGSFRKV